MPPSIAIGIDFGTYKSCAAAYNNGKLEMILNDQGSRTTPSCVSFAIGRTLTGDVALHQSSRNPKNTIFSFKRLIGRWYEDPAVRQDKAKWPFDVVSEENRPMIRVQVAQETQTHSPEKITAEILGKIKQNAESQLKAKVTQAVLTVPAHFNDNQKLKVKEACELAGLEVLSLINDTTAAALAYAVNRDVFYTRTERKVLVFDLGGGSLEVAVIVIVSGDYKVLSIRGDNHLGGEDFTNNLVTSLAKEFSDKQQVQLRKEYKVIAKLRRASEEAKKRLDYETETEVELLNLHKGTDFITTVDRNRFDVLNGSLYYLCKEHVEGALSDAGLEAGQIDDVLMVGGAIRMPAIHDMMETLFPERIRRGINKDEALALGAALRAASLTRFLSVDIKVIGRTPLAVGFKKENETIDAIIPRNNPIPGRMQRKCATTDGSSQIIGIYQSENNKLNQHEFIGSIQLDNITSETVVSFELGCADGLLKITRNDGGVRSPHRELTLKREHKSNSSRSFSTNILNEFVATEYSKDETNRLLAMYSLKTYISKLTKTFEDTDACENVISNFEAANSIRASVAFMNANPEASREELERHQEELEERFSPQSVTESFHN